jgi:O-antigen/teichoic acid export membrane protein
MVVNDENLTGVVPPAISSGFNFRKLFSDVIIYSSGNMLIKGLSLISAPIFTRLFDPAQYGVWSYINVMVTFLTGILLLGGDNAYTRYYFLCKDDEEKKTLTATWFSFLALWSIVVMAVLLPFSGVLSSWMLGDHNYRAAWIIGLASSPLAMMNLILAQALRNRFQAKAFALFNLATAILTICLAVFFVLQFNLGVAGALLGVATASLIMIPIRLWTIRDMFSRSFSVKFLRQLLIFGLPLVPMNIAFWLFSNADRLMLARLASLDAVGLYSIAGSMAAVIMLLQNAIGQSWLPHGIKVFEEDEQLASSVFVRTMVLFLAAMGIIITGFVALAQEVIFILVPPAYYAAFTVIPFLATGFIFFTSAHVSIVAIMAKNKTSYIMLACWLIAALNIGLNALFIPRFGIAGAGAATGLSYMLFALSYALISRKLWPVDYPQKTIIGLITIPLLAVFLIYLISLIGPGVAINLLFKMLITLIASAGLAIVVLLYEKLSLKELLKLFFNLIKERSKKED